MYIILGQNDLNNGGQGAPLTPIFHKKLLYNLVANKEIPRIWGSELPVIILNIGGIANITGIASSSNNSIYMYAQDIGPGNCLS